MTKKRIKCSICGEKIPVEPISGWTQGNNAQPVNDGRCCNLCNSSVVIPTRLGLFYKKKPEVMPHEPDRSGGTR